MNYPIRLNNSNFSNTITNLIRTNDIESVVETGTYDGLGSTSVFAATGIPVYTIECNEINAAKAKTNLAGKQNVVVFHGYSLKYRDMVSFIINDEKFSREDVKEDFKENAKCHYLRELTYYTSTVKENLLPLLCCNKQKQIIFLDSAGGMGYLECRSVLEKLDSDEIKSKILVLDDIQHVKHYRSVELLKMLGYSWVDCGRFGYSVLNLKTQCKDEVLLLNRLPHV